MSIRRRRASDTRHHAAFTSAARSVSTRSPQTAQKPTSRRVTSHVFRKTAATELDRAGLSARQIADQLGHAQVSMTQDRYLGRKALDQAAADVLDRAHQDATAGNERSVSGP